MFGIIPFKANVNSENTCNYLDNFFNDFLDDSPYKNNKFDVDIKDADESYIISAELPGIKKEDINLDYKNNYLIITAKKEQKNEKYIKKECSFGEFKRSFYFDNIDEDKISAKYEDGVLDITLPKEVKKKENISKIKIE